MLTKKIEATVVIVDLRNFTAIFEMFKQRNDSGFIEFIKKYYTTCYNFAKICAYNEPTYINHMGDGFLAIFYGKRNIYSAYLYGLMLYSKLEKLCNIFNDIYLTNLSFGIGIEYGEVEKVTTQGNEIETYLGSVINIATRIEATTKILGRTKLIIGEGLYTCLVKALYENEYERLVRLSKKARRTFEEIISHHNQMNVLNQQFMLLYIFEHQLKGVDEPFPLYRLSPTLASNTYRFLKVVKMLCIDENQYELVKKELKEN